ncbi:hypothetical protein KY363_06605 [Candidatus Woesearchaeota archaeon]|nr:hypothetical protein [Candidatus Woesearchaeota archaeon]
MNRQDDPLAGRAVSILLGKDEKAIAEIQENLENYVRAAANTAQYLRLSGFAPAQPDEIRTISRAIQSYWQAREDPQNQLIAAENCQLQAPYRQSSGSVHYIVERVMAKSEDDVKQLQGIIESYDDAALPLRDLGFIPENPEHIQMISSALEVYRKRLQEQSLDKTCAEIEKKSRKYRLLKKLGLGIFVENRKYAIIGAAIGLAIGIAAGGYCLKIHHDTAEKQKQERVLDTLIDSSRIPRNK